MAEEVQVYRYGKYIMLVKPKETPAKQNKEQEDDALAKDE